MQLDQSNGVLVLTDNSLELLRRTNLKFFRNAAVLDSAYKTLTIRDRRLAANFLSQMNLNTDISSGSIALR